MSSAEREARRVEDQPRVDTAQTSAEQADGPVQLGVAAVIRSDDRILIIRRSAGVAAPLSWAFPGGAVGPQESEREALVREMQEELGIRVRPVRRVWSWHRPHPALILHCWEVDMADQPVLPNPAEVAEAVWLTAAEIRRLPGLLPSCLELLEAMGV